MEKVGIRYQASKKIPVRVRRRTGPRKTPSENTRITKRQSDSWTQIYRVFNQNTNTTENEFACIFYRSNI